MIYIIFPDKALQIIIFQITINFIHHIFNYLFYILTCHHKKRCYKL